LPPSGATLSGVLRGTALFSSLFSALVLAQTALGLGKRPFLLPQKARVSHLLSGAERGKRLQAHVNVDAQAGLWQGRRVWALTGEAAVPLARPAPAPADGRRLGHAFQRTMEDDLDRPDAIEPHARRVRVQLAADRPLHVGDALVALVTPGPTK